SEMRMAEKDSGSLGFSKKEKISRIGYLQKNTGFCHGFYRLVLGGHRRRTGAFHELDVETQRLQLFDQNIEALGESRLQGVLTLDDGFVHPRPALHVVALDRQELLQGIGCAVRLHGPHLHFAEALTTELRLATERLLGDQRVGTDRARV